MKVIFLSSTSREELASRYYDAMPLFCYNQCVRLKSKLYRILSAIIDLDQNAVIVELIQISTNDLQD